MFFSCCDIDSIGRIVSGSCIFPDLWCLNNNHFGDVWHEGCGHSDVESSDVRSVGKDEPLSFPFRPGFYVPTGLLQIH